MSTYTMRELLEKRLAGEELPPLDDNQYRRVSCPVCCDEGTVRIWHPKSVVQARRLLSRNEPLEGAGLCDAIAACNCHRGDKWHALPRYNDRTYCRLNRSTVNADDLTMLAEWIAGHLAVHVAAASKANYQPSFADWNTGEGF